MFACFSVSNSIMLDAGSEVRGQVRVSSRIGTLHHLGRGSPREFGPLASLEMHHVLNYTGEEDGELILGIEGQW